MSISDCVVCVSPTWLLVAAVSILGLWLGTRKPQHIPPGPPTLPLIGNLLSLSGGDVRHIFQKLRKQYGDVFSLYFGNKLVIVFNGYETLKEAFVKYGDNFSDRPKGLMYDEYTKRMGVVSSSGQLWKEQRKFSLSVLRDLGLGKSVMETRIHEEVMSCLDAILSQNGAAFDISSIINKSVCNIISSLAFGKSFEHDDPEFRCYMNTLNEKMKVVGGTSLGHFFPILKYCPGDPLKVGTFGASDKIMRDFIRKQIALHKRDPILQQEDDFANAYLREIDKQLTVNAENTTFSDEMLVCIIVEFFVAGTETTATTLRWALLYLILHPDIQEKAQLELDQVFEKEQQPSMSDRRCLPFMEALIMEVQRLADVVPFSVPHAPPQTTQFRGFTIPENTMLLPNISSVLSDPDVWGYPETFRPERFLDESGSVRRDEAVIPFFMGRRICLGESLARMELFLFLASLLKTFTFRLPEVEAPPDLEGILGITRMPRPFRIIATPRHNT
ncbi:cytochrome P450 2J3-like [Haliotis rufescens]|uniref:cytochrome P450 2J3-like n=1 Tax=Haliotis rufescens TaxID=6454 RepID=UPI00201F80ED|nr:cytochrome P450 2J3-like [Haliotis rufescens]